MAPSLNSPLRASRMRIAMGTYVSVKATAKTEMTLEAGILAALNMVARLETELHPRRHGSDIAAINTAVIGALVPVGDAALRVLELATRVFATSAGRFDPCLATCTGDLSAIELAPANVKIHERVDLDLGGIAKGYAVDRALAVLKERGCMSGSVNIGGEVAAFGAPEDIEVRRSDGSLVAFTLDNEAVAVTSVYSSSHPSEHRGYYQRVPNCIRAREYAAIAAPSAAIADALTKCALYCSDDELAPILARFDARLI